MAPTIVRLWKVRHREHVRCFCVGMLPRRRLRRLLESLGGWSMRHPWRRRRSAFLTTVEIRTAQKRPARFTLLNRNWSLKLFWFLPKWVVRVTTLNLGSLHWKPKSRVAVLAWEVSDRKVGLVFERNSKCQKRHFVESWVCKSVDRARTARVEGYFCL